MHGANNYPWRTKMRSNYDVDLEDGTGDDQYLAVLSKMLRDIFSSHNPSLIFFQVLIFALAPWVFLCLCECSSVVGMSQKCPRSLSSSHWAIIMCAIIHYFYLNYICAICWAIIRSIIWLKGLSRKLMLKRRGIWWNKEKLGYFKCN